MTSVGGRPPYNKTDEPGYSHLTNVPTQSHPMIIPPQQQGNGDCFSPMYSNSSNVPIVCQQEVFNASFFQGHQSSPPIHVTFNQSNTSGVTDSLIEPYEDLINYWPANRSTMLLA